MAASSLFRVHNQRALASPSRTFLVLALQVWKTGEIILTLSIHHLKNSQHVINLALTPWSSEVTFQIQYSIVQHFSPPPPHDCEAVTKLFVEQVQCYWPLGDSGWPLAYCGTVAPESNFSSGFLLGFFLPFVFCLVELSGNCWSQNNSISREECFGVSTCIIIYILL